MCASCSILLIIASILSTYNAQRTLKQWELMNVSVPTGSFIYGYSSLSHDIFLLNTDNLTTYNVLTNEVTIYPSATSHLSLGPYCHAYINHTVYFVSNYAIGKYNLNTNTIEYPFTQKTVTAEGSRACCTLSNDAKYLFILGGSPTGSASNKVNQFIVYDIDQDAVSSGPVMNERRSSFKCHVMNDVLYAIGGDNNAIHFDSIERIDVQNMDSIDSRAWVFTSSLMLTPRNVLSSTIFNNYIYIIGGNYKHGTDTNDLNLVARFDVDTELLYLENSLPVTSKGDVAVTADNRIYVIYNSYIYWNELGIDHTNTLKHWELMNISVPTGSHIYGYSEISHDIFLLNTDNLTTYNVLTNQVTIYESATSHLSLSAYCHAQINYTVYFVSNYSIGKYNLNTNTIEYPFTQKTVTAEGSRACCTLSNDAKYLFILGGSPTGSYLDKVNQFIVYDIDKDVMSWGPAMNERRSSFKCHVMNDVLYAIGGDNHYTISNSIERIDVQNMNSIDSKAWVFTSSLMNIPRNKLASTVCNNDIYIIGGYYGRDLPVVERFDADTESLYIENALPVTAIGDVAVTVNNRIYVIYNSNIYWNELVTINATTEPTPGSTRSSAVLESIFSSTSDPDIVSSISKKETNYMISIEIVECVDSNGNCAMNETEINNIILIAFLEEDVAIYHTEISDNMIIIKLSVKTNPNQILDADVIEKEIENELQSTYGSVDVNVEVENEYETSVIPQAPNDNDMLFSLISDEAAIGICVAFFILGGVCATYFCFKRYKNKQNAIQLSMMKEPPKDDAKPKPRPHGANKPKMENKVDDNMMDESDDADIDDMYDPQNADPEIQKVTRTTTTGEAP